VISSVRKLTGSKLARNTFWMLGGRGVRLVLQVVYFLLIARTLGADEYGAFVGAVALMSMAVPFSSWGTGYLLIKQVARDRVHFRRSWGTALGITTLCAAALLCLVLLLSRAIFGSSVPVMVLLLVGISELFMTSLVGLATQAFIAVEALHKTAEVNVVMSAARLLAAVVFVAAVHMPTAMNWSALYLLSGGVAAGYGIMQVTRQLGPPALGFRLNKSELKEGFYFAIGLASQTIYNDVDKTMLVRLSGLGATGVYGAAYRIVDVVFAPVASLVYAANARFFRHGANGIQESVGFARKLLRYTTAYGLVTTLVLVVASPVVPMFLGSDFAATASALRWLSPLVVFKSIHYFLADALTGSGFQGLRAAIQMAVAGFNVLLNLWLIPAYSWKGAAWASLASDGLLVLGLWIAGGLLVRGDRARMLRAEIEV
jgi:O-antigen/teichoic acid export membrane protein